MTKLHKIIALLCAFVAALIVTIFRMQIGIAARDNPSPEQRIERGRALVENVAMCADCHTPRLPTGAFDRARWLQGGPVGFKPLMEMPWAAVAPGIAGLPGYTEEQGVAFLMTGKRPDGRECLPPMPAYRLSGDEARAVVAYLRSLPGSSVAGGR
jgi:mono/diheme cytochrome c family protein